MSNKLCGTLIVYNGLSQDYCYIEAIKCLQSFCDYTIIVDCGSIDGTAESLKEIHNDNTLVIYRDKSEWDLMKGRTKLAYYTNIAIDKAKELGYEWQFNLQADEILHQDCFPIIRSIINITNAESFWSERINMWGNSKHYLEVPDSRKPVGTEIIRLTKTKYNSVDDAQSIDAQVGCIPDFYKDVRIYHLGFIRSKYVHTKKIKHMLTEIFLMDNDKKVEEMGEVFDCWGMGFSKEDVKPITEELPIFIQKWAKERDEINQFTI